MFIDRRQNKSIKKYIYLYTQSKIKYAKNVPVATLPLLKIFIRNTPMNEQHKPVCCKYLKIEIHSTCPPALA